MEMISRGLLIEIGEVAMESASEASYGDARGTFNGNSGTMLSQGQRRCYRDACWGPGDTFGAPLISAAITKKSFGKNG